MRGKLNILFKSGVIFR